MKTYDINLVFTAHTNLTIEANSQKEAIELAWIEIEKNADLSNPDGVWELGYADEM
jgi:hypothetical protein